MKRKTKKPAYCSGCPQRNAQVEVKRLTAQKRMKYASNCSWLKREGECANAPKPPPGAPTPAR